VVGDVTSSINLLICCSDFLWVYKKVGQVSVGPAGENVLVFNQQQMIISAGMKKLSL
jgi:hypothetical protein